MISVRVATVSLTNNKLLVGVMLLGFSVIESLEGTHQPKTLLTKISNQWVSCI